MTAKQPQEKMVYLDWKQYIKPKVKKICPETLDYYPADGSDGIINTLLLRLDELAEIVDSQQQEIDKLKSLLEEKEKC